MTIRFWGLPLKIPLLIADSSFWLLILRRSVSKPVIISRIVIHARDKLPMVDDAGINVTPNMATDIAIQRVSIIYQKLTLPNNLFKTKTNNFYNLASHQNFANASTETCYDSLS